MCRRAFFDLPIIVSMKKTLQGVFYVFYLKIWRRLPTWICDPIRTGLWIYRRAVYGWDGVPVRVEGVEYKISHKSGAEFRRARRFPTHEPDFLQTFSKYARQSQVIYDIGAAIGTYSLLAAKLNPESKVFSFEPESHNYFALMRNVELNKAECITALNIGLGDQAQKLNFVDAGKVNAAGVGTHRLTSGLTSSDEHVVDVRRGDDLVADKILPPPNMIKLDVEGFEVRVIKGLQKTINAFKPKILIEIHPLLIEANGDRREELDEMLISCGYRCRVIRQPGEGSGNHTQFHMLYSSEEDF